MSVKPANNGNLNAYLNRFYHLNVVVIGKGADRHERPHKPVMLLAVLDLIESGQIVENRIDWSGDLRERFRIIFDRVRSANDHPTPENPFFYLRTEGFWRHVPAPGREDIVTHLSNPPRIGDLTEGIFHVELDPELFALLANPGSRVILREALISRFFPNRWSQLTEEDSHRVREESDSTGRARSAAFRHLILETYDYQCVACGIRIRLPDDITIVDAAHLVPFAVSRNDHPTNGFALCKNHHWAFDRHLMTPTLDRVWRISERIEARRSPGEADLARLEGERLLPPRDEAFAPNPRAIEWRMERLLN